MTTTVLRGARWAAIPLVAALVALAVQVALYRACLELLDATVGLSGGSDVWAAKTLTCLFMGAAFVAVAWWCAPAWKSRVGAGALGVVAFWGGRLIFGAFADGFSVWLLAMGTTGIAGGAVALWSLRAQRGWTSAPST
jgi:hypothetical protein